MNQGCGEECGLQKKGRAGRYEKGVRRGNCETPLSHTAMPALRCAMGDVPPLTTLQAVIVVAGVLFLAQCTIAWVLQELGWVRQRACRLGWVMPS